MINAHKEEGSKMTPDAEDESYEKCREMGLYFTFIVLHLRRCFVNNGLPTLSTFV